MKTKQTNLILLFFALLISQTAIFAQNEIEELSFLIGTWKVENKDTFEVWEIVEGGGEFKGNSYKIKDGQKKVTETLVLKAVDGQVYYLATVPDQNEGKTVKFTLSSSSNGEFTFENPAHDFPKKIIYKKVSDTELFVKVFGDGEKGFSFTMNRIEKKAT